MADRRFTYAFLPVLLALALLGPLVAEASAAKGGIRPAEERFGLILEHHRAGSRPDVVEGTHVLSLEVYPLRGVAVASTASNDYDIENNSSVAYAERIPKGRFDGHLDVRFPGLGRFVGNFAVKESEAGSRPEGCPGPRGLSQFGALDGSIEFHGGGYRSWTTSHALAFLDRSPRLHCRPGAAKNGHRPKNLFGYIENGPGSFSGWRYNLRARLRRPHRFTELAVFRYEDKPAVVNFDAGTYEWLPGEIATGRFVNRSVAGGAQLEVSHGGYHPESATLRPPKPYSGVGNYSRATHRITGSLAVEFPGLKLRLGGSHTVANLLDEAGLREKAPTESFAPDRRLTSEATPDDEATDEVEKVSMFVPLPTDHETALSLEIFPAEGVAVARTYYSGRLEPESGATYAVAIPAAPFDGSLDLDFPGLGKVVGTVAPTHARGPVAKADLCEQRYPSEAATFEGQISFHGAGDPRHWRTTKAEASIVPDCGAPIERRNGPGSLFHHLDGFGPSFSGDFIRLFANYETKKRRVQFVAVGDRYEDHGTLLAIDSEWVDGVIATQRWVKGFPKSFEGTLHFPPHERKPARVVVTPPAPFFGRATYLRRTGKLTGSLGVRFPGLTVRLAHPPAEVIFEDEEPG